MNFAELVEEEEEEEQTDIIEAWVGTWRRNARTDYDADKNLI